jgi:hypothetical protein
MVCTNETYAKVRIVLFFTYIRIHFHSFKPVLMVFVVGSIKQQKLVHNKKTIQQDLSFANIKTTN